MQCNDFLFLNTKNSIQTIAMATAWCQKTHFDDFVPQDQICSVRQHLSYTMSTRVTCASHDNSNNRRKHTVILTLQLPFAIKKNTYL